MRLGFGNEPVDLGGSGSDQKTKAGTWQQRMSWNWGVTELPTRRQWIIGPDGPVPVNLT